jgi:outer membrane receptor for ferrienterochelin and colicins
MSRLPLYSRLLPFTIVILCGALLVFPVCASAERQEPLSSLAEQEQTEKVELLAELQNLTELATKTKMNADYVPGIISVLHRGDLLALGLRTVSEALQLVPGIQVEREPTGDYAIYPRGFADQKSIKMRVLVDSVVTNSTFDGDALFAQIPIEQIDRIEVIRGPGSAVHGEFAFAGVINIVTRDDGDRVHVRLGNDGTQQVGGVFKLSDLERDWHLSLNLSGWKSRGDDITTGTDVLYELGLGDISLAPGSLDAGERYGLAVLKLRLGDFSLLAHAQQANTGAFFGALNALPSDTGQTDTLENANWSIQASQRFVPGNALTAELKLLWQVITTTSDEEILPPGAPFPLFWEDNVYPNGLRQELYGSTRRAQADLDIEWSGWNRHLWRIEFSAADIELTDAWWAVNGDLDTLQPLPTMVRYTGAQNYIDEDAARSIQSLSVQDQWSITERLAVTAGLRYDHYSDVGDNLAPRLSAVWRLTDEHLLKAQIAEAFNPLTLVQVHQIVELPGRRLPTDPETIQTTELGYIRSHGDTVARATLFHSDISNLYLTENGDYVGQGAARLQGVELEWEQRFGPTWKLLANLSYNDTQDKLRDGPFSGAARWLGNLALFYRLHEDLLLTGRWQYVGKRERNADDPRDEPLDGYDNISLTLNWFDAGIKGLTLRAGVTNLLSEHIRSPAPALTYRDDYLIDDERTWWAQLSYEW